MLWDKLYKSEMKQIERFFPQSLFIIDHSEKTNRRKKVKKFFKRHLFNKK